jgi:predicted transcriptional regulator of viral defense system
MIYSTADTILNLAREKGILRPRDLDALGIPRRWMSRLNERGKLVRVGRGLYTLPDAIPSSNRSLAEVSKRVPSGVICLLSALQYHGLTTQIPHQVWVAVDSKARMPKAVDLPIKVVWFSGDSFTSGIDTFLAEGVEIHIYNPAKTVADCFKFRNKIGLDVAVEALKDCLKERKATIDQLWNYAKICRVSNVIKPYMETIL